MATSVFIWFAIECIRLKNRKRGHFVALCTVPSTLTLKVILIINNSFQINLPIFICQTPVNPDNIVIEPKLFVTFFLRLALITPFLRWILFLRADVIFPYHHPKLNLNPGYLLSQQFQFWALETNHQRGHCCNLQGLPTSFFIPVLAIKLFVRPKPCLYPRLIVYNLYHRKHLLLIVKNS